MSRTLQGALLAVAVLVGNAAHVVAHLGALHRPRAVLETDHRVYIQMARQPPWEAQVDPPFRWRLLTPWLVHLATRAGLGVNPAFYLLTNLSLFGFLVLLHGLLGRLGFSSREAALGLALVGLLQGAVRWYEYQYWMTDPLCLLLVTAAFMLVRQGRLGWLAALSVVGVIARETYLLVLPYHLLHEWRRRPPLRALGRAASVSLPALLVLGWIRYGLLPHPGVGLIDTMREVLGFRWRHLLDNQIYFATLGSFGVLLPLALLDPSRLLSGFRERYDEAAVLALAYASLSLANNTDRLLAYALPVLLPLALRGLREGAARAAIPWTLAASVALGLQVLFFMQTRFHGEMGLSIYQPTNWVVVVSMLGFWLAFEWRISVERRSRAIMIY